MPELFGRYSIAAESLAHIRKNGRQVRPVFNTSGTRRRCDMYSRRLTIILQPIELATEATVLLADETVFAQIIGARCDKATKF